MKKQKNLGILFIILSAFSFAWMSTFVRLAGDLPSVQKSFFRNIVAVFVALITLLRSKEKVKMGEGNLKYLILRATFGTIGILGNFYAIDHLVLSDANMLNKMSPFFVILFSYLILKEELTIQQGLFVVGAFLGSLFIIKPTFANANLTASLAGLLGGICAGAAYSMVRVLGKRGCNSSLVVFFFSAFSCVVTFPMMMLDFEPMTIKQLLCLLGAGVAATCGQFSITAAYFHAPAKEISVYDYSQIIFTAIIGFFLFHQVPDAYSILGYAIICAMAVLMFLYNNGKPPFTKHLTEEK